MPSSNPQMNHDVLAKSKIPEGKFEEINQSKTIPTNENLETIQNNNLLEQNEVRDTIGSQPDNIKEKNQQQDMNFIFDFFTVWSRNNYKKALFAIGLITQEKIYLSPIHNEKIKNIPNSGGENHDSK